MIIYYSILAYTCFVAWFGCFVRQKRLSGTENEYYYKRQNSISIFFAFASLALLVYFVGVRTDYQDTYTYIETFKNINIDISYENFKNMNNAKQGSAGFYILEMLFKKYISTDFTDWFFFLAILQAGAIALFYYRYSENFTFSVYLFITSTTVTQWMMNGIRQFTAICFVLYFFNYVVERKFFKFLIIVIIAYFLHSTAIFWIPMYFIIKYKPFSKQIWTWVALTLIVVFFVDTFTDLLNSSFEGTKYEGEDISAYGATHGGTIDDGVNPIRVIVYAIPPAIALWRRKYVEQKSNPLIDILINMSTATVGIYLIGMVTSGILVGRVPGYFELGNYILLPWLINNTFEGKFRKCMKVMCILGYFAYFYYAMQIQGYGYYISSIIGVKYI